MKSALGMCNTALGFKQIHIVGVLERYFVGKTVCELVHAKIHPASDAATKPAAVNERVTEPRHGRNRYGYPGQLGCYRSVDIWLGVKVLNDVGLDPSQYPAEPEYRTGLSERISPAAAQLPLDKLRTTSLYSIVPVATCDDRVNLVAVISKQPDPRHAQSVENLVLVDHERYRGRLFFVAFVGQNLSG